MKDAIDKRNEREKIAKSIVKSWNVIYTTKEELEQRRLEEERQEQIEEERRKSDEILKRLGQEAKEDEKKKADEIQAILMQQELESHKSSESYGTAPMDGVTQEKVEAILNDKERAIQELIQNTGVVPESEPLESGVEEESAADFTQTETEDEAEAEEDVL